MRFMGIPLHIFGFMGFQVLRMIAGGGNISQNKDRLISLIEANADIASKMASSGSGREKTHEHYEDLGGES